MFAVVDFGPARGSAYDAEFNVAEIGAVTMGEIGAVRKRSR